MNGAQDLGGMMGFGPIAAEPDEPVFHHDWERRALALTLAAGACRAWTIDAGRHARETLPPAAYLTKSYYDIWISALEKLLRDAGMIQEQVARGGRASARAGAPARPLAAADVARTLAAGAPYDRPAAAPARFRPGQTIRTKMINPATHTRLPRYARGRTGVVETVHGCFVYPDSNAHGAGENPQWCYGLRFTGEELWGADADPALVVAIDAWEPYLDEA